MGTEARWGIRPDRSAFCAAVPQLSAAGADGTAWRRCNGRPAAPEEYFPLPIPHRWRKAALRNHAL